MRERECLDGMQVRDKIERGMRVYRRKKGR